jgi:hypothetical protein
MGAWVPGRAVPWCLGRLPWAPGVPPGGSLGGGPGPMSAAQKWVSTPWIRTHKFNVSVCVCEPAPGAPLSYAIGSLGGPTRSWGPLGSVLFSSCGLGSLFWLSWAPFGAVLGCPWPLFGSSWGLLGPFWGAPGVYILSSHGLSVIIPINPSTLSINPSTHQPSQELPQSP